MGMEALVGITLMVVTFISCKEITVLCSPVAAFIVLVSAYFAGVLAYGAA